VVKCTVFGGFSLGLENLPIIIVIIGAANRKIFKKEKCRKWFAASRLFG
jgi:hypothetical protein